VGDRLDTDIEAAVLASMPSLLVLTGVSTAADLLAAPAARRPTHVAFDLRGLVDDTKLATVPTDGAANGTDDQAPTSWTVEPDEQMLVLTRNGPPVDGGDGDGVQLAALARLAAMAWDTGINRVRGGDDAALAALRRFGLVSADVPAAVGGRV
jgi:glycerol 3-phosphatase-2